MGALRAASDQHQEAQPSQVVGVSWAGAVNDDDDQAMRPAVVANPKP